MTTSGSPCDQPGANAGSRGRSASLPLRRAGVGPLHDRVDLRGGQAAVVLERAVVRIGAPRRHLAVRDLRADRLRPRARVLVGDQRHRRDFARPMAADAAGVEDRRDVTREGRRLRRGRRTQSETPEDQEDARHVPSFRAYHTGDRGLRHSTFRGSGRLHHTHPHRRAARRPAATPAARCDASSRAGAALFAAHCSGCHSGDDARAPSAEVLHGRSPQAIIDALTGGLDEVPGSGAERRRAPRDRGVPHRPQAARPRRRQHGRRLRPSRSRSRDPPRVRSGTAGDRHRRTRIFSRRRRPASPADQVPRLHLKWAFGFPDATSAWAQPTIAGGRLFVGSQNGTVYSLDAASGCIAWTFAAQGGVRASITIGPAARAAAGSRPRRRPRRRTSPIRRATSTRWTRRTARCCGARKVDDHPLVRLTGSPTLYAGSPLCTDLVVRRRRQAAGLRLLHVPRQRSSRSTRDRRRSLEELHDRRGADAAPRVRRRHRAARAVGRRASGRRRRSTSKRGALYVGAGNSYSGPAQPTTDAVLAFDLKTGAIRWAHQMTPSTPDVFGCMPGEVNCGERPGPDFDFGASPVLATLRERPRSDRRPAEVRAGIRARSRPERASRSGAIAPAAAAASAASSGASPPTRARLLSGRRYLQPGAGRPARGGSRDRRARVVRAAAAAGVRQAEPRLQRRAVLRRHGRFPASSFRRRTTAPCARIRPSTGGSSGRSTPTASSRHVNGLRREGRVDERPGAGRRRRHGLRQLGLRRVRSAPRKCFVGVWH